MHTPCTKPSLSVFGFSQAAAHRGQACWDASPGAQQPCLVSVCPTGRRLAACPLNVAISQACTPHPVPAITPEDLTHSFTRRWYHTLQTVNAQLWPVALPVQIQLVLAQTQKGTALPRCSTDVPSVVGCRDRQLAGTCLGVAHASSAGVAPLGELHTLIHLAGSAHNTTGWPFRHAVGLVSDSGLRCVQSVSVTW